MNFFKNLFKPKISHVSPIRRGINYFYIDCALDPNHAENIRAGFNSWNKALVDNGFGFIEMDSPNNVQIQIRVYNSEIALPSPWESIAKDHDVISFWTPQPTIIYINTDICVDYIECIYKSIGQMLYHHTKAYEEFRFALNKPVS